MAEHARWRQGVVWAGLVLAGLWLVGSPVLAGVLVREKPEALVRQADFVFVAEVTSHSTWSKKCEAGLALEVRSIEILKGPKKKKFENFPYRIWWPTQGPECGSVSFVQPPRAQELGVGQRLIALVGGGHFESGDSVSGSFDVTMRSEIEGWLKK